VSPGTSTLTRSQPGETDRAFTKTGALSLTGQPGAPAGTPAGPGKVQHPPRAPARTGEHHITAGLPGHHLRAGEQAHRTAVKEIQPRRVSDHELAANRGRHDGRETPWSADAVRLAPKRDDNLITAAASTRH